LRSANIKLQSYNKMNGVIECHFGKHDNRYKVTTI